MQVSEELHIHGQADGRARLAEWVKAALLIGLGLYFAYNIASGNLTNYVNERFAWLSYVAAGLFLLLGAGQVVDLVRRESHQRDHDHHDHHDDHDHVHGTISWPALVVIAVPLALGTLIPSRPLGSAAIDGNISLNAVSVTGASTFTGNPLEWNVLDWLRAFNQSGDPTSFDGKAADVIGFVYREPTFPEGLVMVARFTVSCCVADASAIGLPMYWMDEGTLAADTWVRVKGTFKSGDFKGDRVPILQAESVETVEQPEHPYLYP